METPRTLRQRPARNPTPRLSERKKSLFTARGQTPEINSDSEQENYALEGIAQLNGTKQKGKKRHEERRSVGPLGGKNSTKKISFLKNSNGSSPERMDDDVFEKLPESPPPKMDPVTSPLRRSRRLSVKPTNDSPPSANSKKPQIPDDQIELQVTGTAQKTVSDELPALFTNSMNLNRTKKSIGESSEDECDETAMRFAKKRNHTAPVASGASNAKVRRLDQADRLSISTRKFYSQTKTSPIARSPPTAIVVKRSPKNKRTDHKPVLGNSINKGVRHKIRKKPKQKVSSACKTNMIDILSTIKNERLRNLLTAKRKEKDQIENIHRIFKSGQNPIEMAKPLSVIGNAKSTPSNEINDGNNNTSNGVVAAQVVSSNRCYMNGGGDLSIAFSDIEMSSESESELPEELTTARRQEEANDADEESENRTPTPVAGRKFFKSGYSTTRKEVKITDNIKASMCNGKLSLMENPKRKKKIKLRNTQVNEFSSEQAKVDEILKNFDITVVGEEDADAAVDENKSQVDQVDPAPSVSNDGDGDAFEEEMRMTETEEDDECYEFRRRLPYNTSDPELIEQQHTLLDFLINNKMCNEENFAIFISDTENHKEEAQRIIDEMVVVVGDNVDEYRNRIPYNTTNPAEIEQQHTFLEFLIEHNMCNEENFQIFIADYANRHEEADRIITDVVATTHNISADDLERELHRFSKQPVLESAELEIPDQNKQIQKTLKDSPEKLFPIFYPGHCKELVKPKTTRRSCKTWNGGHGLNQYQIDAGQKQFGARQCKQCGLVYTVHEPEEEKLHKEFHASLYVLKFKSWIDEDIVQIYPEWGADGRILRITENSHVKRQERLKDVLQLVDKELGFSSYVMPTNYVAYFAVRQSQIVGVCLVQPLTVAHRYISLNGVDCCTEETFEAKCGISRIWVSPLHRRFHIASKLIRAVQLYTIFGEEVPLEKIAFSAPTEDGKKFAKNVTKSENFLVYQ